ncbi:MAG: hypothetical protein AABX04_08045 [Nanoarchaeota archaeon]
MRTIWKVLAWVSMGCGLATYFIAWIAIMMGTTFFSIPTEFWFYDAISAGIFGLFFLKLYGMKG